MGLVYLGRDADGRTVAVKVVQAGHAQDPEFRARFAREVAAARRVGGSWTAAVLGADTDAATPWVATQYVPGPDLTTVVGREFGPLPEHSVRVLAHRLALALQAVHGAGLIHRDLKPSNVLVTFDGPRVIDFGIARAFDNVGENSLLTRTGMLIGSPGFMSPEQVRGLELTPASDVFCLGAVIVYAATGRLLFGATDTGLNAHLFRVAEEEADLTGVPESLVDLVRACLHKDPARRPTPAEVADRTAADGAEEWLPGPILARLGRHAAQLLDYSPAPPAESPAARPDPRVEPVRTPGEPSPHPAYTPTSPAYSGAAAPSAGPPPVGPGTWGAPTAPAHPHPRPPAPPQSTAASHPRRWWGLVVLALAQLVVLTDATASTTTATGNDRRDSGLALGEASLYALPHVSAFVTLLLFGGRLADRVGRKRMLIIALVGFAVTVIVPAPPAHILTGAFAGLVTSTTATLVSTSFADRRERGKAFRIYVAVAGSGPALGLVLGARLLEITPWPVWQFAGGVWALIAVIGVATLVQDRPDRLGTRFDPPAVLLGSFGTVTLALTTGPPGFAALPLAVHAVGITLIAAFLWRQTRSADTLAWPSGPHAHVPAVWYLGVALAGLVLAVLLGGAIS